MRASSSTCASLAQLRKPGRSPLAPVSRVFCAVGWPFICSTPHPGLPSIPRKIARLLTWQAAAVASLRLIDALQDRAEECLRLADQTRGLANDRLVDPANLSRPLW